MFISDQKKNEFFLIVSFEFLIVSFKFLIVSFEQSPMRIQQLLCGKNVSEIVNSHPDLVRRHKLRKNFEFFPSLTTHSPLHPSAVNPPFPHFSSPDTSPLLAPTAPAIFAHEGQRASIKRERHIEEGHSIEKRLAGNYGEDANGVSGAPAASFIGTLPSIEEFQLNPDEVVTDLELIFALGK